MIKELGERLAHASISTKSKTEWLDHPQGDLRRMLQPPMAHLVGCKVRAHKGNPAAVQREGHRHGALVAAHAQHAARYARCADLACVRLHACHGMKILILRLCWEILV